MERPIYLFKSHFLFGFLFVYFGGFLVVVFFFRLFTYWYREKLISFNLFCKFLVSNLNYALHMNQAIAQLLFQVSISLLLCLFCLLQGICAHSLEEHSLGWQHSYVLAFQKHSWAPTAATENASCHFIWEFAAVSNSYKKPFTFHLGKSLLLSPTELCGKD